MHSTMSTSYTWNTFADGALIRDTFWFSFHTGCNSRLSGPELVLSSYSLPFPYPYVSPTCLCTIPLSQLSPLHKQDSQQWRVLPSCSRQLSSPWTQTHPCDCITPSHLTHSHPTTTADTMQWWHLWSFQPVPHPPITPKAFLPEPKTNSHHSFSKQPATLSFGGCYTNPPPTWLSAATQSTV